jgi:hypothetical protein
MVGTIVNIGPRRRTTRLVVIARSPVRPDPCRRAGRRTDLRQLIGGPTTMRSGADGSLRAPIA